MDDLLRQLIGYARGAWTYRWWGLVVAWVVGVAGAITIYVLPDKYEASARIFVDTQSVIAPLMAGLAVPSDIDQQVTMLSKTLISRPHVEQLIRMADLDLKIKSKEQRESLIEDVTRRLKIQSAGRDNLYTLSYLDGEPERAKRVVQSLVSIFVESGLGDKRKDTDSARRFIEEQIKNYAQKLDEAEARLKDFRIKNLAVLGDNEKDALGQMGDVMSKLKDAQLELHEAENSRDAIKRQLAGEEPVLLPDNPNSGDSAYSVPELDGRIEDMKKKLDDLLRQYTDKHPDVIGTRNVLAQLEQQRADEIKARKKAGGGQISANNNPVYQQMKVTLMEADGNVASLQTRVAEYEARAAQLREFMKLGPQVEQEFAQLNRDYDINKKNYEGLVARRESANMSVEMDSAGGVAEFRLIDPPSVPSKPAAPNRSLLMPLVGLAALAIGVAIAFLMSQLRPAFHDSRTLREATGLPILGSVSMTPDPGRIGKERRGNFIFVGAVGSLAAVFGALTLLIAVLGR
ncbi:MAG TPA: XrtA system polysaccharide chain length determinant [Rhodocyclaceae bacterium]|nr:XrtA system polysaccharide chain length determinant [Rhodocyclaceae bacterium]